MQWYTSPLGEHLERFAELQPFGFHHEAKNVAANVADPTFERLALRVHLQTWPAVVVPRTEAHEVAALSPQLHVAADEVDDVDRLADLVLRIKSRS
jgi:hypothetical protein